MFAGEKDPFLAILVVKCDMYNDTCGRIGIFCNEEYVYMGNKIMNLLRKLAYISHLILS